MRKLVDANLREHLGIYILASASSAFLSASQYLAVFAASAAYLPVNPGISALITSYGRGIGIVIALLLNSILFQGILAVLVLTLALSAIVKAGWKWAYAFSGVIVSGFVGYWLGVKFLVNLEWISTLQSNRVDSSIEYTSLFWFGLAATICYLAMILVLRKSYGKLLARHFVERA